MKLSKKDKKAIIELFDEQNEHSAHILRVEMKNMFPEIFKEKLEKGRWYKTTTSDDWLCFFDGKEFIYGFVGVCGDVEWVEFEEGGFYGDGTEIKATSKEVEKALIKEAKKRWLKLGNHKCLQYNKPCIISTGEEYVFDSINNILLLGYSIVFDNGKWATPIGTITKEEAEKKLNLKIID